MTVRATLIALGAALLLTGCGGDATSSAPSFRSVYAFASKAHLAFEFDAAASSAIESALRSGDTAKAYQTARSASRGFGELEQSMATNPHGFDATSAAMTEYESSAQGAYRSAARALNNPTLSNGYEAKKRTMDVGAEAAIADFKADLARTHFSAAQKAQLLRRFLKGD